MKAAWSLQAQPPLMLTFHRLLVAALLAPLPLAATATGSPHQLISRAASFSVQQAAAAQFSGQAEFSRFPPMPSTGAVAPAIIRFAAGALTNWHIHPDGQYLIVIEGKGRTQQWGGPVEDIQAGDVIWCPPGIKHWHGASAQQAMTHIALSPLPSGKQTVTWLEKVQLAAPQIAALPPTTTIRLSTRQLAIVPIAALSASGDLERLTPALQDGLAAGLTVNDIKEILSHQSAYAGVPRSLNGLSTFKTLLEARQQAGITDPTGAAASRLPANTDYYAQGAATMESLTQQSANRPLFAFAPVMDHTLKAHLFGYLFSRDNLTYIERELVTIATLAAIGRVDTQLQSHLGIALRLGLDRPQLQRVIDTLQQKVSPQLAVDAAQQLQILEQQQ